MPEERVMSTLSQQEVAAVPGRVSVRALRRADLEAADRVMRTAFGTFLGVPDPMLVFGDADYVYSRFSAEPDWAFAAELDGEVAGSNFATRWGSYGFFGPLTVRPDLWDAGIGSRLMQPVIDLLDTWAVRQAGLFTFPHSAKHVGLYQKFGFWPQYLTSVMGKAAAPAGPGAGYSTYSSTAEGERDGVLTDCRELTGAIFDGLDLTHEIRATQAQRLGDTVVLDTEAGVAAFAVCHCRAGEAGSDTCFIKFGAVRPGPDAGAVFEHLVGACEDLADRSGASRMVAGVNTARHDAYRRL